MFEHNPRLILKSRWVAAAVYLRIKSKLMARRALPPPHTPPTYNTTHHEQKLTLMRLTLGFVN